MQGLEWSAGSDVYTGQGVGEGLEEEMLFPDQISGPPVGWKSARSNVAMFRAIIVWQTGFRLLSVRKASCMGQ